MPHVVTGRCVGSKYTDCCTVCPVDSFYEVENPRTLVIDPDTCIDCGLCAPECPVHAIYPEDDVPEPYREWIDKNRQLVAQGTNITAKKNPLPSAKTLEQVQEHEKNQGWNVTEPPGA